MGPGTPAQAKDIKIGVVNYTLCCSYFIGMDKAIADEASACKNITVLSTDAAKLTSNVEDLRAQKVDGLIISGGPLAAAPEALDAAKKAGAPVVHVDRNFAAAGYCGGAAPERTEFPAGWRCVVLSRQIATSFSSSTVDRATLPHQAWRPPPPNQHGAFFRLAF